MGCAIVITVRLPPWGGEWVTISPLGGEWGGTPGEALVFIIVLYYIYIHFTVSLVACPDVYVFQLLAPVRRCCFTRALRVIDGLLEDACERVAAVLCDGHKGRVLRTLLFRHNGDEVGVLSVGKVLLNVVASPEYRRLEALEGPEEGGLP